MELKVHADTVCQTEGELDGLTRLQQVTALEGVTAMHHCDAAGHSLHNPAMTASVSMVVCLDTLQVDKPATTQAYEFAERSYHQHDKHRGTTNCHRDRFRGNGWCATVGVQALVRRLGRFRWECEGQVRLW